MRARGFVIAPQPGMSESVAPLGPGQRWSLSRKRDVVEDAVDGDRGHTASNFNII